MWVFTHLAPGECSSEWNWHLENSSHSQLPLILSLNILSPSIYLYRKPCLTPLRYPPSPSSSLCPWTPSFPSYCRFFSLFNSLTLASNLCIGVYLAVSLYQFSPVSSVLQSFVLVFCRSRKVAVDAKERDFWLLPQPPIGFTSFSSKWKRGDGTTGTVPIY